MSHSSASVASSIHLALLVRIKARSGHEKDVSDFLKNGLALAQAEKETLTWYALQFSSDTFGVFDTFHSEAGREAHLNGAIGSQLPGLVQKGIIEAPHVEKVTILASKLTHPKSGDNQVALIARITPATAAYSTAVHDFLLAGLPLAEEEPATNTWYGLKFSDGTYGVFDSFPNDAGRQAHLNGKIGSQLPGLVEKKVIQPPGVENVQLLAVKLP
jgi:quinol monooxygenase YgiN